VAFVDARAKSLIVLVMAMFLLDAAAIPLAMN
jgi:hypothetical protein